MFDPQKTETSPGSLIAGARATVWSIAASDSGGGAGLQADNLSIYDLGGHPCNLVTGVTAQNSVAVTAVQATPISLMSEQANCLAADMPPRAIKIGVLVNRSQVHWLTKWLKNELPLLEKQLGHAIPVIWDPVMLSSTGQSLTDTDSSPSVDDYLELGKLVTLITPNFIEIRGLLEDLLTNEQSENWQILLSMLVRRVQTNVLLTGGDCKGSKAVDWLFSHKVAHTSEWHQQQFIGFKSDKIETQNNHGTGCTFSSAIASAMALGHPMLDAICIAKAYVTQGLMAAYSVGKGAGVLARQGWPSHLALFPEIQLPQYPKLNAQQSLGFAKVKTPLQIYPVTQSLSVLEQVLKAGAFTVQLRIKKPINQKQLEHDICQAILLGRKYQAQVFINDHWQLAIKHGAFGVHLGQEDMLDAVLGQISAAGLALGLSSHGYFEMLLIRQINPSYLAVGHIFATPTKSMPSPPQGLLNLARYTFLLNKHMPLVAIGGIDSSNLAQVASTNIPDVAVVRAIEQSANPGLSWQKLQHQWQGYK